MIPSPNPRTPPVAVPARAARDTLTHVELVWIERRLEHWIRFGRIAGEQVLTRRTRIVSFRADAVFAFVRWSANDFGTVRSRIEILRAVGPGEACSTMPFVCPGAQILLSIEGWPKVAKVAKVLEVIDAIEAEGLDPCDVAPDHWCHVHSRLTIGERARPYTAQRHEAWLKRKALGE
jgi:hypothetical protein